MKIIKYEGGEYAVKLHPGERRLLQTKSITAVLGGLTNDPFTG